MVMLIFKAYQPIVYYFISVNVFDVKVLINSIFQLWNVLVERGLVQFCLQLFHLDYKSAALVLSFAQKINSFFLLVEVDSQRVFILTQLMVGIPCLFYSMREAIEVSKNFCVLFQGRRWKLKAVPLQSDTICRSIKVRRRLRIHR